MSEEERKKLNIYDEYLFKELERLQNANVEDSENLRLEIGRSNAMALIGKTLIQSVALKTVADKKREEFKKKLTQKMLNG